MSSITIKESVKHKESVDQIATSPKSNNKLGGSSCSTGACWYSGPKFCWVWIIIVAIILIALIIWLLWWLFGKKYAPKPVPVNPARPPVPLTNLTGTKCDSNSDCPTGQVCINNSTAGKDDVRSGINATGVCGQPSANNLCKTHSDCLNTQYCHTSGQCIHKPLPGKTIFNPCSLNDPCLGHLQCDYTLPDPPSQRYIDLMDNGRFGVCRGSGFYPITEVDQVVLNDVKYGNVKFHRNNDGSLCHSYNNSHTDASKISFDGQSGTLWYNDNGTKIYLTIDSTGEIRWSDTPARDQFNIGWDNNDAQMFYLTDRHNNISCHNSASGNRYKMIFTDKRYYTAPSNNNPLYYGTFRLIKVDEAVN